MIVHCKEKETKYQTQTPGRISHTDREIMYLFGCVCTQRGRIKNGCAFNVGRAACYFVNLSAVA